MKRNIRILYGFRALRSFALFSAVFLPFFAQYDLSQAEFFLTQSIFAISIVVLEIPSGYLADRNGRKQSLLFGASMIAAGFWGYALGDSIEIFIVCELLLGIGYSFLSGADEALAYDSLQATGEANRYKQFEANSNGFMAISATMASVGGGLLAIYSLQAPFIGQAFVGLIPPLLCLFLVEPPRSGDTASHKPSIKEAAKQVAFGNRQLRWLVAYGAVITALTHTAVWLLQPYYELVNIPIGWFGVVWAAQSIAQGVFSRTVLGYERLMGFRPVLVSLLIIGVATYLILGVYPHIVAVPAVLGFVFVRAVQEPLLRQAMNDLVDSAQRATTLSVSSMINKLLYATLGPLIGVAVDAYSVQIGLLFSAVIYGILGGGLIAVMARPFTDR